MAAIKGLEAGAPLTVSGDDILTMRHRFLRAIREFFAARGYIEVETPYLMHTAPPDPHIEPLRVYMGEKGPFYLHTSPELYIKKLLAPRTRRIFELSKVFRVEELEEVHSVEFTMLEWYREGTYGEIMAETADLVESVARILIPGKDIGFDQPYKIIDLEELLVEKTGINPFELDRNHLFAAMESTGFGGIDGRDTWTDLFFKLFIQNVEPAIRERGPYFIKDWPSAISTMAKKKGTRKVERFELYVRGLELANGYTELLDPGEQKERFARDNEERRQTGKPVFPVDEDFLAALSAISGPVAGVALGVDRLLMALLGKTRIDDVLPQRLRF